MKSLTQVLNESILNESVNLNDIKKVLGKNGLSKPSKYSDFKDLKEFKWLIKNCCPRMASLSEGERTDIIAGAIGWLGRNAESVAAAVTFEEWMAVCLDNDDDWSGGERARIKWINTLYDVVLKAYGVDPSEIFA